MPSYDVQLEACLQALEQEDFDRCLQLAARLQQENPEAADPFHISAMAYQYQYEWEKSIIALDQAIENAPYDSRLFNLRAFAKMNQGDLESAEKDLREAIELEDLEAAHRNQVLLYILREQYDEAAQYLLDRITTNPDDVENWIMMGDLMKGAGHEEKAETYFEEARKRDPDHPIFA